MIVVDGSSAADQPQEHLEMRRALTRMSRELYRQGLLTPSGGNLSVRLAGGAGILITPSGLFKGRLRAADMVRIGLDGQVVGAALPGRVPSIEAGVHATVYRARSDVAVVVHGHPPHATAVATKGLTLDGVTVEGREFGRVPRVPFLPPGSAELAEAVAGALTAHDAVLLEGHGVFAAGASLRAAADLLMEVEHACRVMLLMNNLGVRAQCVPRDCVPAPNPPAEVEPCRQIASGTPPAAAAKRPPQP